MTSSLQYNNFAFNKCEAMTTVVYLDLHVVIFDEPFYVCQTNMES